MPIQVGPAAPDIAWFDIFHKDGSKVRNNGKTINLLGVRVGPKEVKYDGDKRIQSQRRPTKEIKKRPTNRTLRELYNWYNPYTYNTYTNFLFSYV
jgi:hypothetical protein